MAVKSEDKMVSPDKDFVREDGSGSSSGEDSENEGGSDEVEEEEDEEEESVVNIKGTEFNLKEVSKDADVEEEGSESEDDDHDSDQEDDQGEEDAADGDESESDDDGDDGGGGGGDEGDGEGKSGWADAMAKVLNMGKDSESAPGLLSKAKLDNFRPKDPEEPAQRSETVRRAIKKEIEDKGRLKPNVVRDRAREKALVKLATRGVVQLFNAVRDQQKDLKSQLDAVGQSTRKREQVFKSIDKEGFLEVLSNNKTTAKSKSSSSSEQQPVKKKARSSALIKEKDSEASTWSVIKDDYMLGAKMKDWDKESDEGEEVE